MIKRVFIGLFVLVIILVAFNWDLISYGIGQAKGQFEIINKAKPIETILSNPDFPDSLKSKINLISEIRSFAMDSIGLVDSENYTTYYDQDGKTSLWNLSACEPYSFTPKTWSFLLLGSFPYKGFFNLEKAKAEFQELKNQGYDARIRGVGGWSTLGWFKDPILSNMLDRSEGRLADLIIHELTHSTLFVKDDIQFNENLASFIGERGAVKYLESKYGKGSFEKESYIMEDDDGVRFTKHMLHAASLLDSLYQSISDQEDSIKYISKHILIDEIMNSLDTIHFHNERYYRIFENTRPNNAYFMSFLRYHSAEDSLNAILNKSYSGDLTLFIKGMKKHHED